MPDKVVTPITLDEPIPGNRRKQKEPLYTHLLALSKAVVGSSILIKGYKRSSITNAAYQVGDAGWFTSRKVGDGFRIWKIEEPKRDD